MGITQPEHLSTNLKHRFYVAEVVFAFSYLHMLEITFISAIYVDSNSSIDATWEVAKILLEPMITPDMLQQNPMYYGDDWEGFLEVITGSKGTLQKTILEIPQPYVVVIQQSSPHTFVVAVRYGLLRGFSMTSLSVKKYVEVDACLNIVILRSKIPSWFKEQQHGQTITLKLPPKWQTQIIGLAIFAVFNPRRLYNEPGMELRFVNDGMHVPKPQIDASSRSEKENI
nr:disease resistance protein (TIR-NBS-LRR class) family [Tanacetum cinerariifolium]